MKTYSVKLNGKELELNKVTVSAMPFNRVFRGKQRSLDQTEEAYFVTADIQDSAVLEISTAEGFDDYEIRPLAFDLSDKRVG
ncbi:MAG: endopolygalacturonase, partial [Clostridia bacterium]|nr:endopolygalacturonase [Clostridia bacterium]